MVETHWLTKTDQVTLLKFQLLHLKLELMTLLSCHCRNESSWKWKKFMLVLAQSVTLSATSWSTEKHVQNGFQKSWNNFIRTQCWSVAQSWKSVMKEKARLSQQIFILWWNLGLLLRAEINGKAWSGSTPHLLQEKVQKSSISWKSHVDCVRDVKGWVSFVINDYREDQRTINSQYYSDILLNKVKPAMREKCCRSQRRGGVILQQDNSYCSIYLLNHQQNGLRGTTSIPFYSPDLAHSDHWRRHNVVINFTITSKSLSKIDSNAKTKSSLQRV